MADTFVAHLEWAGAANGPTPGERGDEELLRIHPRRIAAVLTYLFLAAKSGVGVAGYTDDAEGRLGIVDGRVRMSAVTLRPRITLETEAQEARARDLVAKAHERCFIGNSVSTPIDIAPTFAFAAVPAAAR